MYANYPLKNVPHPHPHDVLCGRGGGTNAHIGNSHWRMLVAANKELYVSLPKKQKMLLSKSIVNAVRSQNPPGRFLQKDNKTNFWYDVGDQRAQEKTSQALREGAPSIRSKIKPGEGGKEDTPTSSPSKSTKKAEPKKKPKAPTKPSSSPREAVGAPQHVTSSSSHMPGPPMPPPAGYHPHHPPPPPPPSHMYGQPVLSPQGIPVPATAAAPPLTIPAPVEPQGPIPERRKKDPPPSSSSSSKMPPPDKMPKQQRQMPREASKTKEEPEQPYYPPPSEKEEDGFDPLPVHSFDEKEDDLEGIDPTFVMRVPLPPAKLGDQTGCSWGSIPMSEAEHARLMDERTGTFAFAQHQRMIPEQYPYPQHPQQQQRYPQPPYNPHHPPYPTPPQQRSAPPPSQVQFRNEERNSGGSDKFAPLPVDGGLDGGVGFSFGSLMSVDGPKLEHGGLSFGSAMSCSVAGPPKDIMPQAVDGGLEAIGTSFGSLSMVDRIIPPDGGLEDVGTSFGSMSLAQEEKKVNPPTTIVERESESNVNDEDVPATTFLAQQKSKGNLLDCSDSEEEDEESARQASLQKSADWQKLQATWAQQQQSGGMSAHQPPSLGGGSRNARAFGRDFEPPRDYYSGHQQQQQHQHSNGRPYPASAYPPPGQPPYYSSQYPSYPGYPQSPQQVMPEASYRNNGNMSGNADLDAMPPPPTMRKQTDEEEMWQRQQEQQQQQQPNQQDDYDDYNYLKMMSRTGGGGGSLLD